MQERLAGRLLLFAERETLEAERRDGTLPEGTAHELLEEVAERIEGLRGGDITKLQFEPTELLRKVPLFRDLSTEDFAHVAASLHAHTVPDGEVVVAEGEHDDSMYLIGRGVVRVSRHEGDREQDLARLFAGDFFGEMALLHREPRTATCRAATPCALYELRREEFDATGAEQKVYCYRPGSLWTTNPLYQKTGGEYYWYWNDHLGTPQQMVDSTGAVVWAAEAAAFGEAVTTVGLVENNLRFPGQHYDGETGMNWNYYRHYNAPIGGYLSADPMGLLYGINMYVYAGGNPINSVDPLPARKFSAGRLWYDERALVKS